MSVMLSSPSPNPPHPPVMSGARRSHLRRQTRDPTRTPSVPALGHGLPNCLPGSAQGAMLCCALPCLTRGLPNHRRLRLGFSQRGPPSRLHYDPAGSHSPVLTAGDLDTSVEIARLRRALDMCHKKAQLSDAGTAQPEGGQSSASGHAPQPSQWMEHLPPRPTQEAVQDMIDKFKSNYPGELLDQDSMPSIHLLSLVHHSLKPGEKIRCFFFGTGAPLLHQ